MDVSVQHGKSCPIKMLNGTLSSFFNRTDYFIGNFPDVIVAITIFKLFVFAHILPLFRCFPFTLIFFLFGIWRVLLSCRWVLQTLRILLERYFLY